MEPPFDNSVPHVVARLEEFFAQRTPWHRRLWTVGTVLALKEATEYADACTDGTVQSTEGLRFVVDSCRREVKRDPGVKHLAIELDRVLDDLSVTKPSQVSHHTVDELRQLIRRAEMDYCSAWQPACSGVALEFRARALASHLLDSGFSQSHLHRWLRAVQGDIGTISDLHVAISEMFNSMPGQSFEVFVPCAAPFSKPSRPDANVRWIDGAEGSAWLDKHLPVKETRRHNGGFLMTLDERDPWAALETARRLVGRMNARVKVATPSNEEIALDGWARMAGSKHDFDIRQAPRQVEIGSLDRMDAVYHFDAGLSTSVDDALELASYMEESPGAGAAITGGWSAIESLLIRPGEGSHHLAADRLAALVTCSLPRAELTTLAYRHAENANDALATSIKAADTNREKVRLAEVHLDHGQHLALTWPADEAAEARIGAILLNRADELNRIRAYVTESLRRLYNQRNMITHAGTFQSVALHPTIRTALSLVAAGLDRIVHAQLETAGDVSPLDLLARAETELRLVGTDGGRGLTSLLD
jgi:hypothetical protein